MITIVQLCDRTEPESGAAYVPMAGRLLRKFGVRYSELHPSHADVKMAFLGVNAPAEKGLRVYFAHGIFSALFAVPTGAAWRSLRQAVRGQRQLSR